MCVSEWMKPFTSFHVMADADHRWKTVFLKHFSRSLGSKCKQFRSDLVCLLIGIKPALLLDYLPPDASKIQQFLIEALQLCKSCDWVHNSRDWTLSNQNLCILTIGKDVLIVNSTALSKNIASPIFFIDITKGLSSPVILTDSMIISSIEESFLCCFDRLLKSIRSSICFNTEVNVPIVQYPDTDRTSDEHKLNVCTLFGRLLCYPVVYWFESSKGYCLDTEELVRHTVEVIMKKHVQEFKVNEIIYVQWNLVDLVNNNDYRDSIFMIIIHCLFPQH